MNYCASFNPRPSSRRSWRVKKNRTSKTSFLKLYNETSRRRAIACDELRSNMILPTRRIVWWHKSWNDAGMPLCSKSRNWKHVWIGTFKARAAGYDQAATTFLKLASDLHGVWDSPTADV